MFHLPNGHRQISLDDMGDFTLDGKGRLHFRGERVITFNEVAALTKRLDELEKQLEQKIPTPPKPSP